ncbi:MAG TPA: MoxR family ATPase [Gaiellales bacterium]|nr:MoxR family ATPase [Gaiellales bacterium]
MAIADLFERGREALHRVVVGNDETIDGLLAALVLEGHVLLEGPPGTAKTLLARSLARISGLDFARIQFTPDLMPADLTGTLVYVPSRAEFELRRGPIFAALILADEINRTPPKTQAALLEAMEEGRVTIEGETLDLPRPFVVCATSNPIEFEGTYPLPEAQLDRFLFKLLLAYPDVAAEREILQRYQSGFRPRDLDRVLGSDVEALITPAQVLALQAEAAAVTVQDDVLGYAAEVASWLRASPEVIVGPSPRGSIALVLAAKVTAASRRAEFVTPDDLQALAPAVLRHRIVLSTDAELSGRGADDVIAQALEAVPVPR